MVEVDRITIKGLTEFRRALRALDPQLTRQLRVVGNDAARVIVARARTKVPQRSGRAAKSIRAASTQGAAQVKGGGKRAAYYPWLEFGGRVGRDKSVRRPFIKTGRYIFVSYKDTKPEVERELTRGLSDLIRRAGLGGN